MYIKSLILPNNPVRMRAKYHLHFRNTGTEVQRHPVHCLKPHSKELAELGFELSILTTILPLAVQAIYPR